MPNPKLKKAYEKGVRKEYRIRFFKKYIVYIDLDDQRVIKEFMKKLRKENRWWKFNKWIFVPKGVVEIKRI
ncbi:MAG: hypothetical protein IH948_03770 [Bacteroidetes bacterium]|nr:hypothetical protein [Bacteroidota bacterium]